MRKIKLLKGIFYLKKSNMNKKLKNLRLKIDEIDFKILNLISKRTKLVKKIKEYKKQKNFAGFDRNREKEIYQKLEKSAKEKELDENFIKRLFRLIIEQPQK